MIKRIKRWWKLRQTIGPIAQADSTGPQFALEQIAERARNAAANEEVDRLSRLPPSPVFGPSHIPPRLYALLNMIATNLDRVDRHQQTFFANVDRRLTAMNEIVDRIEGRVTHSGEDVAIIKTGIDALRAQVTTLQTQIDALKAAGIDPTVLAPLEQTVNDQGASLDAIAAGFANAQPAPTQAPAPTPPPVDNDHVSPGSTPFDTPTATSDSGPTTQTPADPAQDPSS